MNDTKEIRFNKKQIVAVVLLVLILIVVAVLAWFFYQRGIATMTKVRDPGVISIDGTHGENMASLDLSYGAEDIEEDAGKKNVVVKNIICIGSDTTSCSFEIAHTTNIGGLVLNVYPATESLDKPTADEAAAGMSYIVKSSKDKTYYYRYSENSGYSTKPGDGSGLTALTCLNNSNDDKTLAKADGSYHNDTYGQSETRVQKNAEPLYWTADNNITLSAKNDVFKGNYSYGYNFAKFFVIEARWAETNKETDLVYVIVNSGQNPGQ